MRKSLFLLYLLGAVLFVACDEKKDDPQPQPVPPAEEGSVFVLNEGNYQYGNSSVTVVNKNDNQVFDNVFEAVNSRKLGDVLQSMTVINGLGYLVVNNSGKIEVINPETYASVTTIKGFTSPRYMVKLNNDKAYVSEYYANAIRVIDLHANTIVSSIPFSGWGDEMVISDGKLYVCNNNRDHVYIINTATDAVTDSIKVGTQPNSIVLDASNKIWVLCNGNKDKNIKPSLYKIDPASGKVENNYSFGSPETGATRLRTNATRTTLYWIAEQVFSMPVSSQAFPSTHFIESANMKFYGLGIDPYTNEIYVSDAADFVQRSNILRYDESGILRGQFKAGLIAGDFYFYKK